MFVDFRLSQLEDRDQAEVFSSSADEYWFSIDWLIVVACTTILCGGQRTACRKWFSTSPRMVPGIRLWSSGLVTSAVICGAILPAWLFSFIFETGSNVFQGDLRFTMHLKMTLVSGPPARPLMCWDQGGCVLLGIKPRIFVPAMQALYELSYILATSEVKGQLCGVSSSLLPRGSGGLNSGCQAW